MKRYHVHVKFDSQVLQSAIVYAEPDQIEQLNKVLSMACWPALFLVYIAEVIDLKRREEFSEPPIVV